MLLEIKQISLVLILIFILLSCGESPEEAKKQEKMIRKLARQEIIKLNPILDSLCSVQQEERVGTLVDSLLEVRVEEVKAKMAAEKASRNQN